MPILPLKTVSLPDPTRGAFDAWLEDLGSQLAAPDADWYAIARDTLFQLYHPGLTDYAGLIENPATPLAAKASLLALDPHNVTLEPEYYAEVDAEKFGRVKPLLWLWQRFDHSPAGGNNVHLGVGLRRLLAAHIFARCGRNFKCFQFTEVSYGYNLEVGDDVVIHRHVLLDDRGGITLGDRVSIADYANIYSHTHSIDDQKDVTNARTILEDDARITYHATVLAGTRVGTHSMAVKSNAPPEARSTKLVPHHEGDRGS